MSFILFGFPSIKQAWSVPPCNDRLNARPNFSAIEILFHTICTYKCCRQHESYDAYGDPVCMHIFYLDNIRIQMLENSKR